ncbi:MAG: Asp-tRNA(Asn)/Glu-tRNA(Gln) amidotransferase subunit GatC, partial [Brevibacterium aurantiacum]
MTESSAITPEQVEHLASLSRIAMGEDELKSLAGDLSTILSNVAGSTDSVESADAPGSSGAA